MKRSMTRSKSAGYVSRSKLDGNGAFLFAEGNFDVDGTVHILSSASSVPQHAVNFVQNQNNVSQSLFLSVYFLAVLDSSITVSMLRSQAYLHFPFLPAFHVSIQENKTMFTLRSKSECQIFQDELKIQASFISEDPGWSILYILLF